MKRPTLDDGDKPTRKKKKSLLKDVDEVEVVHKKKKKRKTQESILAEDETIVKRKKESNESQSEAKNNSVEVEAGHKKKKKRKKEESRSTEDETPKSQSETKNESVEVDAVPKKKKKRKTEESVLAEDETLVKMKKESLESQGNRKNNSVEAEATPKKNKKRKTEESVVAEKESLESQSNTKNNSVEAEAAPKKKKKGHGKGKTKKREDKKAKKVFESLLRKDSDAVEHVAVDEIKEEEPVLDTEIPEKTKNVKKKKNKFKAAQTTTDPGEQTEKSKPDTKELGICYLQTWKQHRENWHFQKARQLWLIRNVYNEESIDDENFSYLLEYLEGSKGGVRTRLLQNAQAIHDTANDETLNENSDDFVKLNRAKEILQFLSE